MAKDSTFPADDVPDRTDQLLDVLRAHDPVPVPTTALYLAIADKRALADQVVDIERRGLIERVAIQAQDPHYEDARRLAGLSETAGVPIGSFRLTEKARQ